MTQEAARQIPEGDNAPERPKQRQRWRRWGFLSRLLLVLLLVFALVFALGTWVLHQVFVPRIQEYRPKLEQQASALLGVPVRIGAITSQGGGWIPTFELHQVELLNPQGQAALTLPRVVAAVSARSLWWLGFEQIYIDSPTLDVRRDAKGRILLAGLTLGDASKASNQNEDWLFSQPEIVLRKGLIQWTDELQQAPPITLSDVDLLIQNPGQQHLFRLDATPSPEWGERFSIQGDFHHALWETDEGNWKNWAGTVHAQFTRVEVAELRKYTKLGVNIQRGKGALRLWVDVHKGDITGMTADVSLQDVNVTLSPGLPALELDTLSGRLSGLRDQDSFEVQTQALQFTTHDGVKWPGGNVFASQRHGRLGGAVQGVFRADKLDLNTLTQIANRLPFGDLTHQWLSRLGPRGLIDNIQAQWTGSWEDPQTWKASGRLSGIEVLSSLAQNATTTGVATPGRPGIRGATVDFDVSQSDGQAQVAVGKGSVTLPGVFEEPEVALDQLNASVRWHNKGKWPAADWDVTVDRLQFANADAQGSGTLHWRTADAGSADSASRLPGVLELDMALQRADGTKVHRYLPMTIPKVTREYVREAVSKGRSDDVKVRVKGDLRHFPFQNGQGEFRIQAQIKDATYAYVPLRSAKDGNWPALTGLSGLLVFDRASMEVKAASSNVLGSRQLQTSKVQALIANLDKPVVVVQGDVRGPLSEMLDVVRLSPLNALTNGALSSATGQGDALTHLYLELPLAKLENSRVQGSVTFANNDLRITADTPPLYKAKGVLTFSDEGFQVAGGQAKFLGGDVKIEGGTIRRAPNAPAVHNDQTILVKAQGQVTAQGLRDAKELGLVSQLAKGAAGTLAYTASLGFRRGKPEIVVSSSMQGMALSLPQPLVKSAEAAMPLRYEQLLRKESFGTGQALQDLLSLDVGQLVNVDIVRDLSAPVPRVLRGTVGVGLNAKLELPMPSEGIAANIVFDTIDLDAWDQLFQAPAGATNAGSGTPAYWPNAMALRSRQLTLAGRQFNRVVVGGTREGQNWRANMDAAELNGYIEFRQSQGNTPGSLYARLARLSLGDTTASDIENVLDQQPASIPTLDVVVEDLEYKGKKLGRVEVDAVNQGRVGAREWRLRKFNITVPEASLQASGNWARVGEMAGAGTPTTGSNRNRNASRRTAMKFKLDIRDSGALLQRFGMGELVRKAPGVMEGQISWLGSPFALDYPSMQGQFNVDMREGQFLKVEPGVARLLGVLSLQALPRRLILDFRDVFSDGFAFDNIRGDVGIENGIAKTNNLQMKGIVAGVLMEGTANIAKETQDLHVVVVPEINAGTASLFAVAVNPVIGLGTFLAQAIIRRPLIKSNTEEFKVEGSWSDPKVTKLSKKDEVATPAPAPNSGAAAQ
jgi:uncharacterized protein (TIGR02099 family)